MSVPQTHEHANVLAVGRFGEELGSCLREAACQTHPAKDQTRKQKSDGITPSLLAVFKVTGELLVFAEVLRPQLVADPLFGEFQQALVQALAQGAVLLQGEGVVLALKHGADHL